MTAILSYIGAMLPYLLIALPVILIFRLFYNKFKGVEKVNHYHEIGVVIFLLFMTALFSQTILTFLYTGPVVTRSFSNVNIVPFRVFQDNYYAITELNFWQPFIINFLGNICIFIPIGFMLPLLWNKFNRFWKVSLIGLSISLFIEITQLTQARSSDIDDLWLNTLGSMIGYYIYFISKKCVPHLALIFKRR
ncbi:VanZ family protein [Sporosarcina limicola]|uniref:Glycopeptide antibiotics resistance protein n=1 Tax=Sporosarcina limicola TaxID=34101 RepID=A0A927MGS0_9BACL|nr:VanZ family protein [Sporosarcina limicola]MBE1554333.1 glycopeptide antibiotics resistance protein [Sporosarcina limicola]